MVPAGVSDGQVIRVQDLGESSSPVNVLNLTIAIERPAETHLPSGTVSAEQTLFTSHPSLQQPFEPLPEHDPPAVATSNPKLDPNLQTSEKQLQRFDPESDHDLPTIASSNPKLQTLERQEQPPLPKRPPVPLARVVSIISGLIILLLLVSTIYFYSSHQADVNAIAHSQTATALAKAGQTPIHTPTVTITPTPTPQKGLYIAGTYNGSMFDQTTGQTTSISVLIEQGKGIAPFSGSFTFRSPSQGAYPLNGAVDTQGNFSFTVQQSAGQTPLYFYGTAQQDVYLKGNFCSSSTNSCSVNTGYFLVGPRF